MVDSSEEKKGKKIESAGRAEISSQETGQESSVARETEGVAKVESERVSSVENKEIVESQIRQEIEKMQLNPALEDEAKKKANRIEFLGEQEKIEHLLVMAQEKGLAFAIRVAKEMNDPYLLDVFHDVLAKEGFYKKFLIEK